ncbi:hypothetical protein DFH11DRAFT_1069463 [Phellopilus nigrolimitatus]|nr:hypothetical protein DFH11DRAFT_1069463 [Phellopilus nigrolimitatus]
MTMADHHAYQQYAHTHHGALLDPAHISLDGDKHPHNSPQSQMSPPNSTGSCHSAIISYNVPFPPTPDTTHYTQQQQQHPSYAAPQHLGQALTLDPAQLRPAAVGPSRVLTRRQARIAQASAHAFAANAAEANGEQQQQNFDDSFSLYGGAASLSRPQTPSRFQPGAQYSDQRIGLPDLNIGSLTSNNMHSAGMSPPHPSTPASVSSSSGFSHYGFHPYASHSRSNSSSTHPRSTSPAASVVSAATSLSSGSSRPRPPPSSSSIPSFHSTSKPKRRLLNKQRKEICEYYNAHPNSRQEDIAARWGVERSTVSKILKHKNRWLAVDEGDDQIIAKQR